MRSGHKHCQSAAFASCDDARTVVPVYAVINVVAPAIINLVPDSISTLFGDKFEYEVAPAVLVVIDDVAA